MDFAQYFKGDSDAVSSSLNALLKQLKTIHVKKGETLQQKGDDAKHAYFVKQGLLRSFTIDSKGKEHIFMFAPEGWIISDVQSTAMQSPHRLLRRIAVLQKRVLLLLSASATERYQEFIATYPNLQQRVSQRYIASYLGITPEALSRLRLEILKSERKV